MGRFKDLTGQKFGRLTVLERVESNKRGRARWLCKCDCGNEVVVRGCDLKSGRTVSCGCLRNTMVAKINFSHGMARAPIYNTYYHIKDRCTNPNNTGYKNYGGRGIKIADEWADNFIAFYKYVSKLEHFGEEGYSLDRINNDGNYEPGNVRFATAKQQACNTRKNVFVEYDGQRISLQEAAELTGINYRTLKSRYRYGDRGGRLFRPVRKIKRE